MQYRIEIQTGAHDTGGDAPVQDQAQTESALVDLVRTICPSWTLRTASLLMENGTTVTITQEH